MKASIRDRGTIGLIIIAFLLIVGIIGYAISNSNDAEGEYTRAIKIVDKNNEERIKEFQKRSIRYAFKISENEKWFLEIYTPMNSPEQSGQYEKGLFDISKEDFDNLELDKEYWFNLQYYETNKTDKGKVVKVYTENPYP